MSLIGRLAQLVQSICLTSRGLVQSICLTSRGSAVRIRQRPLIVRLFLMTHFRAFSSAGSEHLPYKQRVGGSNPSTPTPKENWSNFPFPGRLAQLVQSICLTSRGSAVRIRQRPLPPLHFLEFRSCSEFLRKSIFSLTQACMLMNISESAVSHK